MEKSDVKTMIGYYYAIPAMVRMLITEKRELEDRYDSLRAMNMDGMPHGSSPGKPVEDLAAKLVDKNVADKIRAVTCKIQILETDAECIKGCLDGLNSRYKALLFNRYLNGYSWGRMAVTMGVPDSTVRNWHDKALRRLGESMEDMPMVDELLNRASRART